MMEEFDPTEVLLNECENCQFVAECFGPREDGCRRYPEERPDGQAEDTRI